MLRILDKPAGITTHTSLSESERVRLFNEPYDGFLEHISMRAGRTLSPVHRLDVGTTGVLLAVDTSHTDAEKQIRELGSAFETGAVQKTYLFLTDRKPKSGFKSGNVIESHITRIKASAQTHDQTRELKPTQKSLLPARTETRYVSNFPSEKEPGNAVTRIEFVRSHGRYSLWRALPKTGKPHQVRLHAESVGLSILGDIEHGGSPFPAMALHASELRYDSVHATSPPPLWFSDLSLLDESTDFITWLAALDRRRRVEHSLQQMQVATSLTYRAIQTEDSSFAPPLDVDLRADVLGEITQIHWYGEWRESRDLPQVKKLASTAGWSDWYVQVRSNRGGTKGETGGEELILSRDDLPSRWTASEEALKFEFRRDSGLSSGLFLDQRANRRWVLDSKFTRVLNLFCYTGGFSVAAAKSGAEKIVSVDLSKTFLEWTKTNFVLNDLDPVDSRYEFRAMDAREYLKWAAKKGLQFDLVVCDPPSFSRSDKGIFKIEKDLEDLLRSCVEVTAPGGRVLFSTNFELMKLTDLVRRVTDFARGFSSRKLIVERSVSPDLDFEFPREPRRMKSLVINVDTV